MSEKLRHFFYLLLALFLMAITAVKAAEIDDRMTDMRKEEIQAKQVKADELADKIAVMQKQLEEERKVAAKSQEKIWQDYTQGTEIERKKLNDQLLTLEERQKLFEDELNKKRQQDALSLQSKEDNIKQTMLEVERLRAELESDRKAFDSHLKELKSRPAEVANNSIPINRVSENPDVLGNRAIQVGSGSSREALSAEFRNRSARPEYYIEIGDILDIDVWRVPDLSRAATVRPDGRISMPVVGDVDVVGLNLIQLKDLLTKKFADYVWSPQVSISVRQFGGRKFIVLGAVGSPGVYRFQSDISIIEAIALAGGFKDHARAGKVMIIRGDVKKSPMVKMISANMDNLIKRGMLTENITVMSNDILYVGKDAISDYKEIINDVINPFMDTAINYFVLHSASRGDHNS